MFGQTFTVPDGANTLTSFSFFLLSNQATPLSPPTTFSAWLFRWGTDRPVYEPIFLTINRVAAVGTAFVEEQFPLLVGLSVTPGDVYVAVLQPTSGSLVQGFAAAAGQFTNSYSGGRFVFDTGCPPGIPTACAWAGSQTVPNADAMFTATFESGPTTTVPEPATNALIAVGLVVLGAGARARHRRTHW